MSIRENQKGDITEAKIKSFLGDTEWLRNVSKKAHVLGEIP